MKLFKSRGIVFKSLKYSETSLIVDIYTRSKGMRSYIISGVRSKKSKIKAGLFQHMSILDIVAYDKGEGQLARLKEVKLAHHYHQMPFDILKSSVALFMLEVCKNCIKENESNESMYDFLEGWFLHIDQADYPIANAHLLFLVELSSHIGFMPDPSYRSGQHFDLMEGGFYDLPRSTYFLDVEKSQWLNDLLQIDRSAIDQYRISKTQRRDLLEALINFYRLHVEQFKPLNSLTVLREVL